MELFSCEIELHGSKISNFWIDGNFAWPTMKKVAVVVEHNFSSAHNSTVRNFTNYRKVFFSKLKP